MTLLIIPTLAFAATAILGNTPAPPPAPSPTARAPETYKRDAKKSKSPAAPGRKDTSSSRASQATVMTADRMDVDYQKNISEFSGNARIKDRSGDLAADRVVIYFDPATRSMKELVATGKTVSINAQGKRSLSKKAVYTAHDGKIVLTGDPRIIEGKNIYAADEIIMFKDQGKTIFKPKARMTLYTEEEPGLADGI